MSSSSMHLLRNYDTEVDKYLRELVGSKLVRYHDLVVLAKIISNAIYQYDQTLEKKKLHSVISFLVREKHACRFVYDTKESLTDSEEEDVPMNVSFSQDDLMDAEFSVEHDLEVSIPEKVIPDESTYADPHLRLVEHKYDYLPEKYTEDAYIRRHKRLETIKKTPQSVQKSKEWFEQRNNCLSATAIAIVLDEDPYSSPIKLFLDKCGRGEPFVENANVHHGKKYENIGAMYYGFRNNVVVGEYGLLIHDKYSYIGASPDGICDASTYDSSHKSKLVGRLLEIKFPKQRRILKTGRIDGDIVPHYYYVQVQTQLFVTKLDECDFLQCKIEEYDSWEEYLADSAEIPGLSKKTNLEKGCLIQLLPKNRLNIDEPDMCLYQSQYIYPPKLHMTPQEIQDWIAQSVIQFPTSQFGAEYVIDRIIYWRLTDISCTLIKADVEWFESIRPKLKQFWDYVKYFRQHGSKIDELVTMIKQEPTPTTEELFKFIHKEYTKGNPDTNYNRMYKEKSEWREEYDKKKASYAKRSST